MYGECCELLNGSTNSGSPSCACHPPPARAPLGDLLGDFCPMPDTTPVSSIESCVIVSSKFFHAFPLTEVLSAAIVDIRLLIFSMWPLPPSPTSSFASSTSRETATCEIAPPKTKMVNRAISIVTCSIAVESSIPSTKSQSAPTGRPPQRPPKSFRVKETEASAKATPPRSPENHMMKLYSAEMRAGSEAGPRKRLVIHEPRKMCSRPMKHATKAQRKRRHVVLLKIGNVTTAMPR
mmetsp:Transcript_32754/g.81416  ORF Transcript_32754/g.81416 Transcript_32754/m.81416 type:complete len:236 (-) Transcript_32754:448-1155(-)